MNYPFSRGQEFFYPDSRESRSISYRLGVNDGFG
jgi:hypothetical protein